jgi:hypothetical protein
LKSREEGKLERSRDIPKSPITHRRRIKDAHLQMGTGERAEIDQNKWDDVIVEV